jgi:hypothetical protein
VPAAFCWDSFTKRLPRQRNCGASTMDQDFSARYWRCIDDFARGCRLVGKVRAFLGAYSLDERLPARTAVSATRRLRHILGQESRKEPYPSAVRGLCGACTLAVAGTRRRGGRFPLNCGLSFLYMGGCLSRGLSGCSEHSFYGLSAHAYLGFREGRCRHSWHGSLLLGPR